MHTYTHRVALELCFEWSYQIIWNHRGTFSLLPTETHARSHSRPLKHADAKTHAHANTCNPPGFNWIHNLCEYERQFVLTTQLTYVLCQAKSGKTSLYIFPTYLQAHAPSADAHTNTRINTCIHVSCREKHCCIFDVAAGNGTKEKQADESGSSMWIIPLLVNGLHEETDAHYKGTRVQVNIHVIAMKQLLGKIRSVITGLKIKWEFFISGAACYSTNRREAH